MSKATVELLDQLHGGIAKSMLEELDRYKTSGEPVPPQLYSNIIKFLKDNGIEAEMSTGNNTEIDRLFSSLPFNHSLAAN
jgi:hypothetical protein